MTNLSLWRMAVGLNLDDSFIDLPVSPHYWKPKTLGVSLLEGVKIVGGVKKDQWLFNQSKFSAESTGLEIPNLTVSKHTHEQNQTYLIYYHTLTIQFTKSVTGNATLNVKFEIGYPLPSTYPSELKEN